MLAAFERNVVSLKSFGDLVIVATCLRDVSPDRVRLAVGSHLEELYLALRCPLPHVVVRHGEAGVPAVFDVRRRGLYDALSSALRLRRALRDAVPGGVLVFDRIGIRERFLALGRPAERLVDSTNVYEAYAALAARLGASSGPEMSLVPGGHRVGIFPSSRLASKRFDARTLSVVLAAVRDSGALPTVFTVEGEPDPAGMDDVDHVRLPRSFEHFVAAVRDAGRIISADSVAAHVAEHWGIPSFVASPVDNRYWLPRSSLHRRFFALFSELDADASSLRRFLHGERVGRLL